MKTESGKTYHPKHTPAKGMVAEQKREKTKIILTNKKCENERNW